MLPESVFLGTHGQVVAVERTTGRELWRTKLEGSDFVNLLVDGDRIIATTKGKVFCVDAATGQPLWKNDLPGLGFGLIGIATAAGSTAVVAPFQKKRRDAADAAALAAGA